MLLSSEYYTKIGKNMSRCFKVTSVGCGVIGLVLLLCGFGGKELSDIVVVCTLFIWSSILWIVTGVATMFFAYKGEQALLSEQHYTKPSTLTDE